MQTNAAAVDIEERFRRAGYVAETLCRLAEMCKDAFAAGAEDEDVRPLLEAARDELIAEAAASAPLRPGQTDLDAYCRALPDAEWAVDEAFAIVFREVKEV